MGVMEQSRLVRTELLRISGYREFLLEVYAKAIEKEEPTIQGLFLFGSLLKLRHQAGAAILLATGECVEEISSLARTMAEVAVNAAYLQYAEPEEVQRFEMFDTQSQAL